MDPVTAISIIVSIGSLIVAGATWLTSASKGRVDSLCSIVSAQAEYISRLEVQLTAAGEHSDEQDARIELLETDLESAKARMVVLEQENRWYVRILSAEGIDPAAYIRQGESSDDDRSTA